MPKNHIRYALCVYTCAQKFTYTHHVDKFYGNIELTIILFNNYFSGEEKLYNLKNTWSIKKEDYFRIL